MAGSSLGPRNCRCYPRGLAGQGPHQQGLVPPPPAREQGRLRGEAAGGILETGSSIDDVRIDEAGVRLSQEVSPWVSVRMRISGVRGSGTEAMQMKSG